MQLDGRVEFVFNGAVFDSVFDALSHHVVVVKLLCCDLLDELGLAGGRFARHDHSGAQGCHFSNSNKFKLHTPRNF